MARIFLSYAHEDVAKAKSFAGSLERAGHFVWWDPKVGGGTRFAAEITNALRGCEVVVVLWSRHSVDSSWVQDEAAEGRDTGKLIPITLDGSRPPLGFRQFQVLDLSRWRGRGRVPNLTAIEDAIQIVLKGGTLARPSEPPRRRNWASRAIAAAISLLIVAVAALYGTGQFTTQTPTTSLAVLPFTDLSPARDKAYFAEGVAEEIRTLLSSVPGVKVVGSTSIAMLGSDVGLKSASKQLGVTHMLEGSMRVEGHQMRLNVRLVRMADGVQIWAKQFERDLNDVFKVQQEVGSAVAEHLRYRLWGYQLAEQTAPTSLQVYDLVLASRSQMFEDTYESALESNRLAGEATRLDPNYSPAWVERSRSLYAIDQHKPEGQWGSQWPANYARALQYARRAVALDPKSGDAQAFLGWVEANGEDPELALTRIRKAMDLSPGEASVWGIAGIIYDQLCNRRQQLDARRRWTALEPLDLEGQVDLVLLLNAFGQTAEANELRRKLAQTDQAEMLEFRLATQRGDYSSAIAVGLKKQPATGIMVAWNLRALGKFGPAIELLPSGYHDSLGAYWLGDYSRAAAQTDFIPTTRWNNARTIAIERSLISTGQHAKLLTIFDKRFRSVEEFDRRLRCHLPSHAAPIAVALERAGRTAEANRLISLAERRYRQSGSYGIAADHAGHVQLLVVAGRYNEALAALDRVERMTMGWDGSFPAWWLNLEDPIYNPIRNHPQFKAVEARIAAVQAKELRELAAAGVRI